MYAPITGSVPPAGTRETETLEFKGRLRKLKSGRFDLFAAAKPVAAFANRVGGTILYGANEGTASVLGEYAPLSQDEVRETLQACEHAIRDLCRPPPRFSPAQIAMDGGHLLAINVEPHPDALVGVRITGEADSGYGGSDGFVFPVRIGSHTNFISAEQLAMYMDPKVRRTLIILSKINLGERVELIQMQRTGARETMQTQHRRIDDELNALDLGNFGKVPVDRIDSVWHNGEKWCVLYTL